MGNETTNILLKIVDLVLKLNPNGNENSSEGIAATIKMMLPSVKQICRDDFFFSEPPFLLRVSEDFAALYNCFPLDGGIVRYWWCISSNQQSRHGSSMDNNGFHCGEGSEKGPKKVFRWRLHDLTLSDLATEKTENIFTTTLYPSPILKPTSDNNLAHNPKYFHPQFLKAVTIISTMLVKMRLICICSTLRTLLCLRPDFSFWNDYFLQVLKSLELTEI